MEKVYQDLSDYFKQRLVVVNISINDLLDCKKIKK